MKRKLDQLTIGQTIFIVSTLVVAILVLVTVLVMQFIFFKQVDNLIEDTSKEINKQVVMNYESYLSDVIETSNSLQEYIVQYSSQNDYSRLADLFESTVKAQSSIQNIGLFNTSGQALVTSFGEKVNPDVENLNWFNEALVYSDIHHFSTPHIEDGFMNGQEDVITISKRVDYVSNGHTLKAVLMLDISASGLSSIAQRTNFGENGSILITDINDLLVFDSNLSCIDNDCDRIDIVKSILLGGSLLTVDNQYMYVNVNTLQDTRWKITSFINVDESVKTKERIFLTMLLSFVVSISLIAIFSSWMARRITNPMNVLKKHITKLEEGDFEAQVVVVGQKEVVHLAEAFNIMSNRIHELMTRIIDEQNEKRKTHYIALQNQINPHFLYNTLDSIVSLSEKGRNKDVEKAIIALSKFFRMSVSSDMSLISLKDEIEHVKHYLIIQQIRYMKDFEYEIDVPKDLELCKVIKLSIQPLVENAIIHGINVDESFKHIKISATKKDQYLYIEVYNQGYGITANKIADIYKMIQSEQATGSMGLKNVYQRLKLYFGDKADLILESELDSYTKVILKLPINQGELL